MSKNDKKRKMGLADEGCEKNKALKQEHYVSETDLTQNQTISQGNSLPYLRPDSVLGRKNAWHRISSALKPHISFEGIKSREYMTAFNGVYDEVYRYFEGERNDSDIGQLAFALGQYDKMRKNGKARCRPKNKTAPLYIHWDNYIAGIASIKEPIIQLNLEKEGVKVLFSFSLSSQIWQEGRDLAAEDYIQGNVKKSLEELTELKADLPEFISGYEETYANFAKGYDDAQVKLRRGINFGLTVSSSKDNDAHTAGMKYALYKFMKDNHLTHRPDSHFLANFYGERDARTFSKPVSVRLTPDFKKSYQKKYNAILDEIAQGDDEIEKNLAKVYKKYLKLKSTPLSSELRNTLESARRRGRDAINNANVFSPNNEKLNANDPEEIAYQYSYYRTLWRKGEKTDNEKMRRKGELMGKYAAMAGVMEKSDAQVQELINLKGEIYTNAYLKAYAEKSSKMTSEKVIYKRFYTKGRNHSYLFIKKLGSTLKLLTFDEQDSLYLLKKEAYLLGLLRGLETKNDKFSENKKIALRIQFTQELNAIHRNPARQAFPTIKAMHDTLTETESTHSSSEPSVRVDKVFALNGEKGLFASRVIYPGELFIEYLGQIKPKAEAEASIFAASLDTERVVDGTNGNGAQYANHCGNPNAQLVVLVDDTVKIEALELIKSGEQILINYGPNYPLENKVGLNPWDNQASPQVIYERNKNYYSPEPYYFEEAFIKHSGLSNTGFYLIPKLFAAMLEEDDSFDQLLIQEALELPMMFIDNPHSKNIISNASNYFNALMLACFLGSTTYAIKLLDAGARGNVLQRNNGSLFHMVFQGNGTEKEKIDLTVLLLKNLVNPFILNNDQVSFIALMEQTIFSKKLKLSVLDNLEPKEALLFACYSKAIDCVELLVKRGQCFDLSCLVEGRLDSDFRKAVVSFLKEISLTDKKLFEALLGYTTLHFYGEYSSTGSLSFFKPPATMNHSENKLTQHFYGLTRSEFDSFHEFLEKIKIFNSYPLMKADLETIKYTFSTLSMLSMKFDGPDIPEEPRDLTEIDVNSDAEEFDEWYSTESDLSN